MGVVPEDKGLWWAQVFALLPDGVVLVDRSFGRPRDLQGPDTGSFGARCVEPHRRWELRFDGAGALVDRTARRRALGCRGRGSVSLRARPRHDRSVYDMHAAMGREMDWQMGGLHHEQGLTATGT